MASPSDELAERIAALLARVGTRLAESGMSHALVGGIAVNLIVERRLTFDVDFRVIASPGSMERLIAILQEDGLQVVRAQALEAAQGTDFVRLHDPSTGLAVDIEAASTEFEELAIRRARVPDGSFPTPAATAEDLIVFKLIASRPKDMRDIADLIEVEGLDWDYIRQWAAAWDVTDRLERVLNWR